MKTAREKAEEWFNDLAPCAVKSESNIESLSRFIENIKKEQDRDTRHACADSVNGMTADNVFTDSLARDETFSAIMNTKSV